MSDPLYQTLISPDMLAAFGRMFPDAASAGALLVPLGADLARMPPFGALPPDQWWFAAFTEMDRGAFPFGLDAVVAAAARRFPGYAPLQALLAGGGTRPRPARGARPLRVLFLLASPTNQARLRLEVEQRTLREVSTGDRLTTTVYTATRVTDIVPALLSARPDLVHFSGHGSASGQLVFEDERGAAAPVPAAALAEAFTATGELECAVLNSCYTGAYAEALGKSARTVIGSVSPLADPGALAFTRGFYRALADGRGTRVSYRVALAEMVLSGCSTADMRIFPPDDAAGAAA